MQRRHVWRSCVVPPRVAARHAEKNRGRSPARRSCAAARILAGATRQPRAGPMAGGGPRRPVSPACAAAPSPARPHDHPPGICHTTRTAAWGRSPAGAPPSLPLLPRQPAALPPPSPPLNIVVSSVPLLRNCPLFHCLTFGVHYIALAETAETSRTVPLSARSLSWCHSTGGALAG